MVRISLNEASWMYFDEDLLLIRYHRRKPTAKKHKTWDGDGVLSVVNGSARLQDVSGKELGRTSYSSALLPGSTLSIGGKEVEIDSVISKSD